MKEVEDHKNLEFKVVRRTFWRGHAVLAGVAAGELVLCAPTLGVVVGMGGVRSKHRDASRG